MGTVAVILCVAILAGQLWRAKRTHTKNTNWRYHTASGAMSLGVACSMFASHSGPSVMVLLAVFLHQCVGASRWANGQVPDEYISDNAPLGRL